jgi:hypothetical protein
MQAGRSKGFGCCVDFLPNVLCKGRPSPIRSQNYDFLFPLGVLSQGVLLLIMAFTERLRSVAAQLFMSIGVTTIFSASYQHVHPMWPAS